RASRKRVNKTRIAVDSGSCSEPRSLSVRAAPPNRARTAAMGTTLFILGGVRIGPAEILSALGLAVMIVVAIVLARAFRRRGGDATRHAQRAADLETRLAEMVRVQADTAGRVHMMGETLSGRQAELARLVGERLDAVTHRLGQSMTESGRHTMESL